MTDLHRAIAHMFCIGFDGYTIPPHVEKLIDRGISGVALFKRNVESPQQFARLCADLKRRAGRPFLICVDQEGGRVMRLRDSFTDIPSMRDLGRTGDENLARQIGQILARELRAVNGDLNFAPVLDVDTNPKNPVIADRSLGGSPELVSRLGVAIMQGIQNEGVAACGKHFAGHGDTAQDSHFELPRLPHNMERLEAVELPPFRAAIEAGVATIMTAHVVYEGLDAKYPATMSRLILQGVLREHLGFNGVIISDDLEMNAIAECFPWEEAVVQSANAGVDLLMVCHRPDRQEQAIDALLDAVERGVVLRDRIDEANLRVAKMSATYVKPPSDTDPLAVIGRPDHRAVVDRIRQHAGGSAGGVGHDPTEPAPGLG
jgi:beta-N-acetylhexosaminidase